MLVKVKESGKFKIMYIEKKEPGETGRDYALRILKNNIISLELKPGIMVSEKDLANEMGLSRTPVREALMDLEKANMVDIYPQRGSMISLVNYDMVEEIQFTRNVLEGAVVQLACENATEHDLKLLEENLLLEEFHINNPQKLMRLDDAFHEELFRIARKMQMYLMLESFSIHFDRVRQMALHVVREIKIVQDHRKIFEAIAQGNAALAKQCMEKHLSRYKVDEKLIREHYPAEYFV